MDPDSNKQHGVMDWAAPEVDAMKQQQRTLQLATVNTDGRPQASYAPFIAVADSFYVLLSTLACHTHNLQAHPQVSLMLIEDEAKATQIFARKRLIVDAIAEIVPRHSAFWHEVTAALQERFGEIVSQLLLLDDFLLFRLKPYQGQYIKGFAQAWTLGMPEQSKPPEPDEGRGNILKGRRRP